jgi:ubiquinone/menaquinone biosynthesis C-methylase UbiE
VSGATLRGIERLAVFNRARAAFGLRWELPPLLKAVAIHAGSQCLEIGTGLGWGTVGLLRTGNASVVTTDCEDAILERARGFVRRQHPGARVKFARVDAKALPFLRERFDVVLSLYVLHHADGYRRAIAEIARVLRPGGCLLLIDLMRPRFLPSLPASMAPEGVLTKGEWHEAFTSSGFTITQWQTRYLLGPLPRCSVVACRTVQPQA